MKILRMYTKLPPLKGGMEKHIKSLSQWQNKNGHEVTIIFNKGDALNNCDFQVLKNINLYNFRPQFLGIFIFHFFAFVYLLFNRKTFDLVHIHGDWSSLLFSKLIKKVTKSKIVVFSIHGQIIKKFTHQKFLPKLLIQIDLVFSTGHQTALDIKSLYTRKTVTQPSGVNQIYFGNYKRSFDIKKKNIITVANLMPIKNLELILEIAVDLPEYDFFIIGDGPLKGALLSEIKNKEIHNVFLLGFKDTNEVFDAYKNSSCFLLTSHAEGTSTSLMEAMVTGLPIISSNAGGIEHIVKNGVNGYIIKETNNPKKYIVKLKRLLNDEELIKKISLNNKKLGETFSWDFVANNITKTCKEALDAKK